VGKRGGKGKALFNTTPEGEFFGGGRRKRKEEVYVGKMQLADGFYLF